MTNKKVHFNFVLILLFISTSFSFVNKFLVPIFVETYNLSVDITLTIQFFAIFIVLIFLIIEGFFFQIKSIFTISFLIIIGLCMGVFSLIFPPVYISVFYLTISMYMLAKSLSFALSSLYTEGLSKNTEIVRSTALMHFITNAGAAISGIIAYYFLHQYKNFLLMADLVFSIALTLYIYFILKNSYFLLQNKEHLHNFKINFRLNKHSLQIWFGILLFGITALNLYSAIPVVFIQLGLDSIQYTSIMSISNTITVTIGTAIIAKLNIQNKLPYLVVSCALLFLGMIMVPFSNTEKLVVLSTFIWTLAEAIGWPVIIALIYEYFKESKSLASKVKVIYIYLCLLVSPIIGIIISQTNKFTFSIIFGGFSILSLLLFLNNKSRI